MSRAVKFTSLPAHDQSFFCLFNNKTPRGHTVPGYTDVLSGCSDLVDQSWGTMQMIEKTLCVFREETHTQPPHPDVFPGFDRYLPQPQHTNSLLMPNKDNASPGHQPARRRRHNNPTQTHFYFQTKTIPHLGTSRRGGAPTTTQHTDSLLLPSKDSASPRHQPARRSFLIKHA